MNPASFEPEGGRIGLALSGGGFRASLFHLGVIRRLEELGIMEKISIVSSVSGGSIIAAYYLCEMEKQLREYRLKGETANRVELFEKIAEKFLKAVDHNLRTRALIYTPRYHPIKFIKYLVFAAFRSGARAELIQAEYDRWFYFGDTMDQLPVERPEKPHQVISRSCVGGDEPFYGPRLLLNATSLLTGERVTFSRDTSSGIIDLKTSDRNVLPLSRVVGASSGVPVLFPPTSIMGDLLVDGGISDNQGIEGLLDPANKIDVILVSDASGQMEVKHTQSPSALPVYDRMSEILQFQIRNKLLELLMAWGDPRNGLNRRFAFVHLLINLKSRYGSPQRVSTSILPALGRIRTDLDQFSPIECEALMYHGYTLIDAQLRGYCCDFFRSKVKEGSKEEKEFPHFEAKLKTPPLFTKKVEEKILEKMQGNTSKDPIRQDLEAGSESVYLIRCLKKHLWPTLITGFLVIVLEIPFFLLSSGLSHGLVNWLRHRLDAIFYNIVPKWLVQLFDSLLNLFGYTGQGLALTTDSVVHLLAFVLVFALTLYIASYPIYAVIRRHAMWLDRWNYKKITGGTGFTVHWTEDGETEQGSTSIRSSQD
ncbi:MAG TPA: patatin-like phospholipase family protein [Terracidiphilus sp.]